MLRRTRSEKAFATSGVLEVSLNAANMVRPVGFLQELVPGQASAREHKELLLQGLWAFHLTLHQGDVLAFGRKHLGQIGNLVGTTSGGHIGSGVLNWTRESFCTDRGSTRCFALAGKLKVMQVCDLQRGLVKPADVQEHHQLCS